MRKTVLLVGLGMFILGAIGYRAYQVSIYPIGTGDEATSPDGSLVASITKYYDETFWGSSRKWVELEIRRKGTTTPIRKLVTEPIPGAVFGSRTKTTVIFWSKDSKSVDFVFPGLKITLEVEEQDK